MAVLQFNAQTVKPQGDRAPVPPGEYNVILNSSEIKPGKAPTDRQLTGFWKILDGPLAGQSIMQNINYMHSNPVAQQIGQERLSALCYVVGVLQINDTTQLHGRPHKIKVQYDDPEKPKYNEITAFLTADGRSATDVAAQMGGGVPAGVPGATPAWATAAQSTGAPPPQAPPAAAPPPAQPPAPLQPPPAQGPKYFVCLNGVVDQVPKTAFEIMQQNPNLGIIQVCQEGTQQWQPGTSLAPAAASPQQQAPPVMQPPTQPGGLPPWMTAPPSA